MLPSKQGEVSSQVTSFCDSLLQLRNPQLATALLRMCGGTCKVTHLMRTLHPTCLQAQLSEFDRSTVECFCHVTGTTPNAAALQQISLPVKMGGFGIRKY